jgi:hypothetical protein
MSLLTEQLPPILDQQNDLQRAIHHEHWEERLDILHALAASFHKAEQKQARQLSACGHTARLYLDLQSDTVRTLIHRCKNRICPWCTHHRTAKAMKQILRIMSTMTAPRTIVLTPRSTPASLHAQITAMRHAFARLRRNKQFRSFVRGGVYAVEVTWNPRKSTWHPHLHLIVDGNFFPQRLLSSLWSKATAGSDIVWVHKVDRAESAAIELAGYIGKPPKVKEMPAAALREYAGATRGIRMLQTFGNCKSQKADDGDEKFSPPPDSGTISVNRIRFLAQKGHEQARQLAHWLPIRWPIFRRFFHPAQDRPPDPLTQLLPDQIQELSQTIARLFKELLGQQDTGALGVFDIMDHL